MDTSENVNDEKAITVDKKKADETASEKDLTEDTDTPKDIPESKTNEQKEEVNSVFSLLRIWQINPESSTAKSTERISVWRSCFVPWFQKTEKETSKADSAKKRGRPKGSKSTLKGGEKKTISNKHEKKSAKDDVVEISDEEIKGRKTREALPMQMLVPWYRGGFYFRWPVNLGKRKDRDVFWRMNSGRSTTVLIKTWLSQLARDVFRQVETFCGYRKWEGKHGSSRRPVARCPHHCINWPWDTAPTALCSGVTISVLFCTEKKKKTEKTAMSDFFSK